MKTYLFKILKDTNNLLHLFGPTALFLASLLILYFSGIENIFWLSVSTSLICVFVFEIGQIDGYHWATNQSHWFIFKLFYADFLKDIGLGILGGLIIPLILKFTVAFIVGLLYI